MNDDISDTTNTEIARYFVALVILAPSPFIYLTTARILLFYKDFTILEIISFKKRSGTKLQRWIIKGW